MSFAGAFGGAVAGSILTAFAFFGLNVAALIPASLIVIASGVTLYRQNRTATA
jgi:hypothetical protein